MRVAILLIAAFVAGFVTCLYLTAGPAHAAQRVTPAAWSSMPCATDIGDRFIRYTCEIERN